jgi:hypothetical protein
VQSITVIATNRIARQMDSTWVTTFGKKTFVLRRREARLYSQCPLLSYESKARLERKLNGAEKYTMGRLPARVVRQRNGVA